MHAPTPHKSPSEDIGEEIHTQTKEAIQERTFYVIIASNHKNFLSYQERVEGRT
jgi:hypothetical protein